MTNDKRSIAQTSDAIMIGEAAEGFSNASTAGMRALLVGAVFLHLKGANKVNILALQSAIAERLAAGGAVSDKHLATAQNYASKCKAAAMPEHFAWAVDVNATLADTVEAILPRFCAFWSAVNNVKKGGPEAKPAPRKKETAQQLARDPDYAVALVERLSHRLLDNSFLLSADTLIRLRDAINVELANRVQQSVHEVADGASVLTACLCNGSEPRCSARRWASSA